MDNVMFPIYALATTDRPRLQRAYLTTLRATVWFLLPLGFLLSAAAYPLVVVLLGSTWIPAVEDLRVLAIAGWILIPAYAFQSLSIATGRPREYLSLGVISAGLMLGLAPITVLLWRGVGLSFAFLSVAVVLVGWASARALRFRYIETGSLVGVWVPALVSGTAAYVLALGFASMLEPSIPALIVILCAGLLGYVFLMHVLSQRHFFRELKSLMTSFITTTS